jgi:hypothetical protein
MTLLADTHVHLYETYDLDVAFSSALANLQRLQPAGADRTCLALLLAERHDCHAFEHLRQNPASAARATYRVKGTPDERALSVAAADGSSLYLVAGRQVATRERLEVLALLGDPGVRDGGDILDTIGRIAESGAVPVLAWAVGKWTGRRGGIVESVLRAVTPGQLLLGDSSMRPREWLVSRMFREAAERGFGIVGGTDPLPFAGQETVIGRYGIAADVFIDDGSPIASLRDLLTGPADRMTLAGRRDSLLSVAARMVRQRLAKK